MPKPSRGEHIDPNDFCVEWVGYATKDGYGFTRDPRTGKRRHIHTIVAQAPVGMHVHHLCHNPPCFRIDHLQILDPVEHGRLHPRDPSPKCIKCEGTEFRLLSSGRRGQCAACHRRMARERFERRKRKLGEELVPYRPYGPRRMNKPPKRKSGTKCKKGPWYSADGKIQFRGESMFLAQWARRLGMSYSCLHRRHMSGWSKEEAFTTPPRK